MTKSEKSSHCTMNQSIQSSLEFSPVPTCEENYSKNPFPPDEKIYLRKRYYVIALLFLSIVLSYILRINVSICIVEMSSNKAVIINNVTHIEPAEYNWTPPEKGVILSSFSWGNLFTPVGILLADRFGGATAIGFTVLFVGCLTILSPTLISGGIYIFMVARGLEGLSEGVTIVSLYRICTTWIPPKEYSRSINFIHLGKPAGTMISYFITGIITYMFGWKSVFYITGAMAVIWYAIWTVTVANTPDVDKFITRQEKSYLSELNKQFLQPTIKLEHPLKSLFTSKAIWAYINEKFVEAWSLSFLTYCLPLYIKDVHSVNIRDIGFISAIPHFFAVFSVIAGSWLQDYIRTKNTVSKTKFHKSFIFCGQLVAIIVLVTIGTWVNFYANMIAFCIFKIGFSIAEVSYQVLPMDLCPQYATHLGALCSIIRGIAYLLNPIIMGFMVQNHTTAEWSKYFLFLACFNLWGLIIFAKFGSGELQPWAQVEASRRKDSSVPT